MFSEVTGKAEAASFSDEVGYLCACCPHHTTDISVPSPQALPALPPPAGCPS